MLSLWDFDFLVKTMTELQMTSSQGFSTTNEGKSIPYTRESCQILINDDFKNDYSLQITRWEKNTTIEILVVSGYVGADAEKRWIYEDIYRLEKLPHAEFDLQRNELIKRAIERANYIFGT
jgi:hypothetical protein